MDTDALPFVSILNRGGFCSGKVFAVQKKARVVLQLQLQLIATAGAADQTDKLSLLGVTFKGCV